jgi:hypothetical protein
MAVPPKLLNYPHQTAHVFCHDKAVAELGAEFVEDIADGNDGPATRFADEFTCSREQFL